MVVSDKWIDVEIDRGQVCHHLGYDADCEPSARTASLLDEYVENAHHLIDPSYTYVIKDVEWARRSISFVVQVLSICPFCSIPFFLPPSADQTDLFILRGPWCTNKFELIGKIRFQIGCYECS